MYASRLRTRKRTMSDPSFERPDSVAGAVAAAVRRRRRCWPAAPISTRRGSAGRPASGGRHQRRRRTARHPPRSRRQLAHRRRHHLDRRRRAELPPLFDGLKLAAREVGGVQIQNSGTVGGNLCNASPAADGMPPLLALDAMVELRGATERRTLPLAAFRRRQPPDGARRRRAVDGVLVPRRGAAAVRLSSSRRAPLPGDLDRDGGRRARGRRAGTHARAARCGRRLLAGGAAAARARGAPAGARRRRPRRARRSATSALAPIDDIRASAAYRLDAAAELLRRALARARDELPT